MGLASENDRVAHAELSAADVDTVRDAIRRNAFSGHTAGLCHGFLQCNLVVLPEVVAADFKAFCLNNPVACPLLGHSQTGEPHISDMGADIDLRTDLPRYRIYKNGNLSAETQDVGWLWRDDFVAFAIGCSFTFERALEKEGVELRHITQNVTVPMFATNILTKPFGVFAGPTVVSMRPIKTDDVCRVRRVCASYPHAHGEPIHVGDPKDIGIEDLQAPEWGSPVDVRDGEVPVFWGCGVTSQVAISHARPDLCITHAPGAMLITDISEFAHSDWRAAGPPDEELH